MIEKLKSCLYCGAKLERNEHADKVRCGDDDFIYKNNTVITILNSLAESRLDEAYQNIFETLQDIFSIKEEENENA